MHQAKKGRWAKTKQRWKEMGLTQAGAEDFFRKMALSLPIRTRIVDPDVHQWLMWLVQGHANYETMCPDGVDFFVVLPNKDLGYPGDARAFCVAAIGSEGAVKDFSVKTALLGVPKSPEERVRKALRHSIEHQVSTWRNHNYREGLRCPVFGGVLTLDVLAVDHDPPFENLVRDFCKTMQITEKQIEVEDVVQSLGTTKVLVKEPLQRAWQEFHWHNMHLQFVSRRGHIELGRRRREAAKQEIRS
jgi:hypothetical protein